MIKFIPADSGEKIIPLPVAYINGEIPAKTVLITGGMDGDEYAGIEAAYRIIAEFERIRFYGKLIIIPIVNIPGYENNSSFNPSDNKYPKNIFPGNEKGSQSERLIHWLNRNILPEVDIWIDLHGPSTYELLDPFIYFYETNNNILNRTINSFIKNISSGKIVYHYPGYWKKIELLSKKNIIYTILESGKNNKPDERSIKRHIKWIKEILGTTGMLRHYIAKEKNKDVFRNTKQYIAVKSGFWTPYINPGLYLSKGEKIGDIRTTNRQITSQLFGKEDCFCLWIRGKSYCRQNCVLGEFGYNN